MIKINDLYIGTFEADYRQNIQLQFNDDEKFVSLVEQICDLGSDYQSVLKAFNQAFTLDSSVNDFGDVTPQNTFILNSIAKLLNVPSIEYFNGIFAKEDLPNITYTEYVLILKGQIAKNAYNGTNKNLLDILNSVFEGQFKFFLADNGKMTVTVYLMPLGEELNEKIKYLFSNGYFTPKPAGVGMEYTTLDRKTFTWDTPDTPATPDKPAMAQWDLGVWN